MLTTEMMSKASDWELDRELTETEENIRVRERHHLGHPDMLAALKVYRGRLRSEIAKRHPYGFPPVLLV